jgi:3-dehydroquinate synthase
MMVYPLFNGLSAMKSISIKFKEPRQKGYQVLIQAGQISRIQASLKHLHPGASAFVISSPRVYGLWGKALKGFPKHLVPDGEQHKNFAEFHKALKALAAFGRGADRKPLVVALGGGVIGDLAGFVAASYKRGVPFVQVPTTLLSMVDSSVGGKLGIDFDTPQGRIKNLVGAFYQPSAVLIDPAVLKTLPQRELAAGLAEVVKTAVLFDRPLFGRLEASVPALLKGDARLLEPVIAACVAHKAKTVMKDEFDLRGARALLNLGHTFGHAVEAASKFKLLHGEAVAFGLCCAVDLSARLGLADPELMRVEDLLLRLGLPTSLKALPMKAVMAALSQDKKFEKGMRFVVPKRLGLSVLLPLPPKHKALVEAIFKARFR